MLTRILTAILGIVAVFFLIACGGVPLIAAIILVAVLAWYEYARMMYRTAPLYSRPAVCALIFILLAASSGSLAVLAAGLFISFVLLGFQVLFIQKKDWQRLFYTWIGVLYFGVGFGSLLVLRGADDLLSVRDVALEPGLFLVWFGLLGTWASDTFAYFVGKYFGRNPMAPHISPNKTQEGLLGGVVGCLVICAAFSWYFEFSLTTALPLALLVAVASPMGDLFESYVKRVCDVKDSGNILPGHGGMMDRFDSLLFVMPLLLGVLTLLRWF